MLDIRLIGEQGIDHVDGGWWKDFGAGFALGGLLMMLAFGFEHLTGWVEVAGWWSTNVAGVPLVLALSFSSVNVLCVGV